MNTITPCLWFDGNAEDAARFYTSVIPNSTITAVSHYGEGMPMPEGTVLTVEFELGGRPFTALNGGPEFSFTEAVSLQVSADDQSEVDHYWEALSAGGEESQCGWLKDKFGLSWQIVPTAVSELLQDPDRARRNAAWKALMTMQKIDIAALHAAADGAA